MTQGSLAGSATLGFGTESRWDSGLPRAGVLRVRDNFGGREPQWNRGGVAKIGDDYELKLKSGESLEAAFPKPETIPPAPDNVAEPVVILTKP